MYHESYLCCNCGQQSATELIGFTVQKLYAPQSKLPKEESNHA
jgi:hypothetical protein